MCGKHYTRWRVHGDPLFTLVIVGDDEARFWSKVDRQGDADCWSWLDAPDEDGYGYFRTGRKMVRAGRYSWELANDDRIPDGLVIDHLCRNRICVNPRHLEPVTNRVNVVIRGLTPTALNFRKTHCVNGHKFTPANTYVSPSGRRRCRKCQRGYERARRERQALAA
jgi:HNH endonuclease